MSDEWHSYRLEMKWYGAFCYLLDYKWSYEWNVSKAWRSAPDQREYLFGAGYVNSEIVFTSSATITSMLLPRMENNQPMHNIQPGDLVYFDWEGNGSIDHSSMITEIGAGEIFVTYHSTDRKNMKLSTLMEEHPSMIGYIVLIDYGD